MRSRSLQKLKSAWNGPRYLRLRSKPSRGRKPVLEILEGRQLLTAAVGWYDTVSPEWFRAAEEPHFLGQSTETAGAASRWIVRLDAEYSAALSNSGQSWQVFYPATAVASDAAPPWIQFRALTGLGLPGQILVEANSDPGAAADALVALPHVVSVERERTVGGAEDPPRDELFPNDPEFVLGEQYSLNNTGQQDGTEDADIDATAAWSLETGSSSVVVAHIDSGIDYTHPDLAANIWTNPGEIPNNGEDDDDNGFIDDVHGYDFVNDDPDPMDDHGHGTHIAGIIAATGDNAEGVTGVAWEAQLMALKFLGANLKGDSSDAIRAFNYMTMMRTQYAVNVLVSNNSWGLSGGIDIGLRQAVEGAGEAGILTIAAAGNGDGRGIGLNNDESPVFPASFEGDTIISVANTDRNDNLARSSNFGRTSVDIAAPGEEIRSTKLGGGYEFRNGTSMAAPHVTGVAALVFSRFPDATPLEVRQAILEGADVDDPIVDGDRLESLSPRLSSGGRLNAFGALTAPTFAPKATLDPVDDITTEGVDGFDITVRYRDDGFVNLNSLGDANIAVRRDKYAFDEYVSVTLVDFSVSEDGTVVAIYHLDEGGFDAFDAGQYTISVQPNQVVDDNGLPVFPAVIGSFNVILSDPRTFIVNTTDDTVDADPGDGLALDAQGKTSLRAAIMEANLLPPSEEEVTILLLDGVYPLTIEETSSSGDLIGAAGDLDIATTIDFWGTGIDTVRIDAKKLHRVFELLPASTRDDASPDLPVSLTIHHLAIVNGGADAGGAILVGGDPGAGNELIVLDGLFFENTAQYRGGAIASLEGLNTIQIENTTFDKNSTLATLGNELGGGAIFNRGDLEIERSTLSNNVAAGGLLQSGGGGGVLHVGPGILKLTNSTISGNTASQSVGGGLSLTGPATVESSTIAFNQAPRGFGGGIYGTDPIPLFQEDYQAGFAVASEDVDFELLELLDFPIKTYSVVGSPFAAVRDVPAVGRVFTYGATTGALTAVIENPSPDEFDAFGFSVAIDPELKGPFFESLIVVGAPFDDTEGEDAGLAYVFDAESGKLFYTLASPSPADGDQFGYSVAISGNHIVVGANRADVGVHEDAGAAYLFDAETGEFVATLENPDPVFEDEFGAAVAALTSSSLVDESIILVGAPGKDVDGAVYAGAVFHFDEFGELVQTLENPEPEDFDNFGYSLAMDQDSDGIIVVGAPFDDFEEVDSGSVYTYDLNGLPLETLRNPTPEEGDAFGYSVATDGFDIMVGAYLADDGAIDGGAAYSFDILDDFSLSSEVLGTSDDDQLGTAVSLNLVGVPGSDTLGVDAGDVLYYEEPFFDFDPTFSLNSTLPGVRNSIVANNVASSLATQNNAANAVRLADNGGNLFSDKPEFVSRSELFNTGPELRPLEDNGGSTLTHDLAPSSPAIDGAADGPGPFEDQTGIERPFDDSTEEPRPDIGAFEHFPGIRGVMFVDRNGDGVRQADEPGLAGQTVYLDLNDNGRLDAEDISVETSTDDPTTLGTDETGDYEFRNLFDGILVLSAVESSGINSHLPNFIAPTAAPEFFELARTSTARPDGGSFTGFRPPVIGNGSVVFAEATTGGAVYTGTLESARAGESDLSLLARPGQVIEPGNVIGPITAYDFDGQLAALAGGSGSAAQILLVQPDGTVVPVTDYEGDATNEISIGNGIVGFRTSGPDSIYFGAIDSENPLSAIVALVAQADELGYTGLFDPRVDPTNRGVVFGAVPDLPEDELDFGPFFTIGRGGGGTGFEEIYSEPVARVFRVLDAAGDEILFSDVEPDGTEVIYRLKRIPGDFDLTVVVDSDDVMPDGEGVFQGLFASNASLSNRAVIFTAFDVEGEFGIFLADGNGNNRTVITTADTLFGKEIKDLQLADGNTLDQNQLTFLAEFDDGSQGIYACEFTPASGIRVFITNPRLDLNVNIPTSVAPAEIHGLVFGDLTRDGFRDNGELELAERTVFLDLNGNGKPDADEPTSITDEAGSYFFSGIDPLQSYTVAVVLEAGELQTAPLDNNGTFIVMPEPGEIITSINFAIASSDAEGAGQGSKISGTLLVSNNGSGAVGTGSTFFTELLGSVSMVFADLDGDGIIDQEDANGNGILDNNLGEDLDGDNRLDQEPTTVPDASGNFSFTGIENSNVQIRVVRTTIPGLNQINPVTVQSLEPDTTPLEFSAKPEGAAAGSIDQKIGISAGLQNSSDLAVTMSNVNQVWIYTSDSSGQLSSTPIQKLNTHARPGVVVLSDLNADDWNDLIVSNSAAGEISIFLHTQNPNAPYPLSTPHHFATRNDRRGVPQGIAVGNFAGDNRPDIAVTNQIGAFVNGRFQPRSDLTIFENRTVATSVVFPVASRPPVGKNPFAIVAAQLVGDSNSPLELAVANNGDGTSGSSSVTILQSNNGTFTTFATIPVANGPTAIAAGQLNPLSTDPVNGNSHVDLVIANYAANKTTILWGQGNGQFLPQEIGAGVGPISVVLADVDGDNDLDIAVSNGSAATEKNHLLVLRNEGGEFVSAQPAGSATFFPDAAFNVVQGDFDGNSRIDLALLNPTRLSGSGYEAGQLTVYYNQVAAGASLSLNVALELPREIPDLDFNFGYPRHNINVPFDVTGDCFRTADDALAIINFLNAGLGGRVPANLRTFGPFYDAKNDGFVVAEDALDVINFLNAFGQDMVSQCSTSNVGIDGEGESSASTPAFGLPTDSSPAPVQPLDDLMALLALDVASQPRRRR